MLKKIFYIIFVGIVLFLVWKYGQDYIQNPGEIFSKTNELKNNLYTSVENLKKEGETRIQQAQDIKNKVDDKIDKLNKAVDAVSDLTK